MISLVETLKPIWKDVPESLKAYKHEIDDLRATPGDPSLNDTPQTLHERLVTSRIAQNRLETIVAELKLVLSRCKIALAEAQNAYDDRIREVVTSTKTGEYQSGVAQNATFQAGAIEQLVALRKVQRMVDEVAELYDYALFKYRGLDGARWEIEASSKLMSASTFLDR